MYMIVRNCRNPEGQAAVLLTATMVFRRGRVNRTTSSDESLRAQIKKIDGLRRKGRLRDDERRFVLRIFFSLYMDARERER